MLLCNSAVVAQYMLPPTLSMVVPGGEVTRPEAVGRKSPHHRRAAEEAVEQRHLLAAPPGDVAALRAHQADHVIVDRVIGAQVFGGAQNFTSPPRPARSCVSCDLIPLVGFLLLSSVLYVTVVADGGHPLGTCERRLLDWQRRRRGQRCRIERHVLVI